MHSSFIGVLIMMQWLVETFTVLELMVWRSRQGAYIV